MKTFKRKGFVNHGSTLGFSFSAALEPKNHKFGFNDFGVRGCMAMSGRFVPRDPQ